VVPSVELSQVVAQLVKSIVESAGQAPTSPEPEESLATLETAMANMEELTTKDLPASPSGFACPSCHGALFELPGEPSPRFRCRVGHAWSPRSLLDEQTDNLEAALWMALRTLEEKAELSRRMAESAAARGSTRTAERYLTVASDAEEAAHHIRTFITRLSVLGHWAVDLEGAS
jgi:two-component system chemotaxis response regulator CheB